MTYTLNLKGRSITLKMKKTQSGIFSHAIKQPLELHKYCKELGGVKGTDKEYSSVYFTPFSVNKIEKQGEYEEAITKFIASFPDVITETEIGTYIAQANKIFSDFIPIVDKRRDKTQEKERKEAVLEQENKHKQAHLNFLNQYAQGEQKAKIAEGQMAVCIQITFNNSDSMSDYYHPHAQIGSKMLLAIVKKQAQKEALARQILAKYPDLEKLTWEWKTENYSGGHGNYLQSEYFGKLKHKAYNGQEEVAIRYEICFSTWDKEMYMFKDYPGIQTEQVSTSNELPVTSGRIKMRLNNELNGVELLFEEKPPSEILAMLKLNRFRWSQSKGLWYAKQTTETLALAKKIAGVLE